MVEFGLKLEDNKLAEWREHYIDYEKLKSILKKCAASVTRYRDLEARQPARAAEIKIAWSTGMPTPQPSTDNLQLLRRGKEAEEAAAAGELTESLLELPQKLNSIQESGSSRSEAKASASPREQTWLSPASSDDYGSSRFPDDSEHPSSQPPAKPNAVPFLERVGSGMTEFFNKEKIYERRMRDELTEIAKLSKEFETTLLLNLERVNAFYNDQLNECEQRLALLKESVAASARNNKWAGSIPPPPENSANDEESYDDDKEEYLNTPLLVTTRKRNPLSKVDVLAHAIARSLGGMDKAKKNQRRLTELSPGFALDDDEDAVIAMDADTVRRIKEAQSIQRALVDEYRRSKLLHNFAIMNYTGFVKIVKKHEKTLKEEKSKYKQAIRPENICNEGGKSVERFSSNVERLYANWFCDRNVNEAQAQLLPKKGDGLQMDWSQLRLGYRMGMCSILGLWVCWDCIWGLVSHGQTTIGSRAAFPVFRACGGLLILQWFWGCSVWVWTRYRVNYIYIMDLDPSIVASPLALFNDSVDDTLIFLLGMLLYYKAGVHDIPGNFPAGIFPAVIIVYTIFRLIFPLRTRVPMWRTIWLVVTAPMNSPTFFQSYVGDIFTSMVKVFQDLAWTILFLLSGDWLASEDSKHAMKHSWAKTTWYSKILIPLLTLLPLWFRFNQCLRRYLDTRDRLPHLANAFKYALSQTVTLFGAFHPLYMNTGASSIFQGFWTFAFVASSLYSFTWDVYMDWGLGQPQHAFLGPRLMYPHRRAYYAIIGVDLVLRFAWVLTLVPPNSGADFALPAYLTMVSMMLELFRRTIWGFLRLEHEHRSNTSGYRRVGFVPLHFSTGHTHDYKHEKEHRGDSVLLEVSIVTLLVLGVSIASVVAAQHATEQSEVEL
jgi:hypothetical protein